MLTASDHKTFFFQKNSFQPQNISIELCLYKLTYTLGLDATCAEDAVYHTLQSVAAAFVLQSVAVAVAFSVRCCAY